MKLIRGPKREKKAPNEEIPPPKIHLGSALRQAEQSGEKGEGHHHLRRDAVAPQSHQGEGPTEHEIPDVVILISVQVMAQKALGPVAPQHQEERRASC